MKKSLLLSVMALGLVSLTQAAQAETVKGKVLSQKGNVITLEKENGKTMSMSTTDNTTYRKKKMSKKNKKKNSQNGKKMQGGFVPMMEEDEWIEVTYSPDQNNPNGYVVEDVVVYDD